MFTAAVCEAEILYGLTRMPVGHKRATLASRISMYFRVGLQEQVLAFDRACAALYGEIRHGRQVAGKPIAVEDAMIAATARAYGTAIATHNIKDFADCGVTLVDPWLVR